MSAHFTQSSVPCYVANSRQEIEELILTGMENTLIYISPELRKQEKEKSEHMKTIMKEWFDRGQNR